MSILDKPVGVADPSEQNRVPIHKGIVGDTLVIDIPLTEVMTKDNSLLFFDLYFHLFSTMCVLQLDWLSGLSKPDDAPNVVRISLPKEESARLRRGSYAFSLTFMDLDSTMRKTLYTGSLLMDYAAGSAHKDIPYNTI